MSSIIHRATREQHREPGVYYNPDLGRLEIVCYNHPESGNLDLSQFQGIKPYAKIIADQCFAVGDADQELHVDVGVCTYEDSRIVLVNDRTGLEKTISSGKTINEISKTLPTPAGCNSYQPKQDLGWVIPIAIALFLSYLHSRLKNQKKE